ncbi:MAG: Mycobacterial persistence regulator [Pseudomonadota bacterium]|jgi:DNA-binding response OmpR family regulator
MPENDPIHPPHVKGKILLVEDEPNLAFTLELNLKSEGYAVDLAQDGEKAFELIQTGGAAHDLYLLDVMLPGRNGLEIAELIRSRDKRAGIIFLTARAGEEDILRGLAIGADDYITKPFRLAELMLKVRRTLQRSTFFEQTENLDDAPLVWGPFQLDTVALKIKTPAGLTQLTRLEADVLREFFKNPGKVLSRQHLLKRVWGVSEDMETRTVDNFMVRLRRLIEADPANPKFLRSVRGRGYVLSSEDQPD